MAKKEPEVQSGNQSEKLHEARRGFLKQSSLLAALALTPPTILKAAAEEWDEKAAAFFEKVPVSIEINGKQHTLSIEPRTTLLDLLREQLQLTGTKKGCDHGQCGACTVHIDGRRVLSCLTLAAMQEGRKITTIEGLANGDQLHPMQEAFIKHDGFQCGYCTPGQIMSAVACIREGHADTDADIREYMSGNICRCGAYSNIVRAVADVKKGGQKL
ncbi:MAG TPA: (2Fe-2S)-binding protein [Flavisolibacter sp.]|jgi:xanthine dehydrogenase YagT iron-sulfur-binding subunit|nr:(2Fe-2S)-binding protein [Flavisolibacter sp.]